MSGTFCERPKPEFILRNAQRLKNHCDELGATWKSWRKPYSVFAYGNENERRRADLQESIHPAHKKPGYSP